MVLCLVELGCLVGLWFLFDTVVCGLGYRGVVLVEMKGLWFCDWFVIIFSYDMENFLFFSSLLWEEVSSLEQASFHIPICVSMCGPV